MKTILKILLSPFFILISLACKFASFIVGLASGILGIVALVLVVLSVFLFITEGIKMGILSLIVALAVSPFGIPLLASLTIEILLSAKDYLKRLIA